MARIQIIEEPDAKATVKAVYDRTQEQLGFVPSVMKVMSLWPEVLDLDQQLFTTVMLAETELPQSIKEMLALVVSQTNACTYCVSHHHNFLQQYGVSEEIAQQLKGEGHSSQLDAKTEALLDYARKVTQHAYKVMPEDVEALRQAGWSDRQILEATVVVGRFNGINRIVDALGAELEALTVEGERSDRHV